MKKYKVTLEKEERENLEAITRKGSHQSQRVVNALILLNCDEGPDNEQRMRGEDVASVLRISMRKIDRQNASFWAAIHNRSDEDALGLLERQRVKNWLRKSYESFDSLPI